MGGSHVFNFTQMVPNRAKYLILWYQTVVSEYHGALLQKLFLHKSFMTDVGYSPECVCVPIIRKVRWGRGIEGS